MVIAMGRGPRRQHRGRNRATSQGVAMMGSSKGVYIAAVHPLGGVWLWVRAMWHSDPNLDMQLLYPTDFIICITLCKRQVDFTAWSISAVADYEN